MKRFLAALVLAFAVLNCSPAVAPVASAPPVAQRPTAPNVIVWVNTNSGVYHCPGTRWYGKTKEGKYMKQKEAQAGDYRPAYGSVCG
jgi:hypothetical protein